MTMQYKICYTATWPDGKLLDAKKPFMEAYVHASSKREAVGNLLAEFPALKVKVIGEPQIVKAEDDI